MRLKFLFLYSIIAFAILGLISVSDVNAQVSSTSILVNIIPANPAPFEDTTITLSSFGDNLDTVLITWSVDGKKVSSGIGNKSFSLNAPATGSQSAVVATISLPAGTVQKNITIRSSVMVLLWQANDSFVPPFYRGKAMPTPDSEVKVVAMPEVRTASGLTDSKKMTYDWKKDYTNLPNDSGYGKNFFLYINDYLEGSNNVSVVASTVDLNFSSEASIDIGTIQPKIIFYKNDPSIGTIWEHALPNPYSIKGAEIVEAAPYFISPKEIQNPRLVWSWFINDSQVNIKSARKNIMPLQVPAGTTGTSKLKLQIESMDKIFETASKEINVEF